MIHTALGSASAMALYTPAVLLLNTAVIACETSYNTEFCLRYPGFRECGAISLSAARNQTYDRPASHRQLTQVAVVQVVGAILGRLSLQKCQLDLAEQRVDRVKKLLCNDIISDASLHQQSSHLRWREAPPP